METSLGTELSKYAGGQAVGPLSVIPVGFSDHIAEMN